MGHQVVSGRDEEREADIRALPWSVRWRYVLRPAWLRFAINRAWPGRWSAQENEQIRRRAAELAEWLQENVS